MTNNKDKPGSKTEEENQKDFYVGVVERKDPRMTEEKIHEKLGDIHKNRPQRLTEQEKEIIRRWKEWGLKDVPQNWKDLLTGKPSPTPSDGSTTGSTTTTAPITFSNKILEAFVRLLLDPPKGAKGSEDYSDVFSNFLAFVSKLNPDEKKQIENCFFRSVMGYDFFRNKWDFKSSDLKKP